MPEVKLKGKKIHLRGNLPSLQTKAPDFHLVDQNLQEHSLEEFRGKKKLIATVPSLDTPTCCLMTKRFNEFGQNNKGIALITVSADLPFAQKRFCEQENVSNVLTLSMMRDKNFGESYGVLMQDGPLAGLLSRAVFILDENDRVLYEELVSEISEQPNYDKAFQMLRANPQ